MTETLQSPEFYFDVDDTLATDIVGRHVRLYNRLLGLGMSRQEVETAGQNYRQTFDVEQIKDYRKSEDQSLKVEHEARFQQVRAAIRGSKALHRSLATKPDAPQGVLAMTRFGVHRGYFTVRPTNMDQPTQQWLDKNEFTQPDQVVICENPKDKVLKILADGNPDSQKVLIDDGLGRLVEAVRDIHSEREDLREKLSRLTIIGFGFHNEEAEKLAGDVTETAGTKVKALRSWDTEEVNQLLTDLGVTTS